MKNIELTKDHKSKLLKMCKELFPEYCWKNSFEFGDNILVYCTSEGCESIHWFEFCWTLLNKILESNLLPIKSCEIIKEFGLICFNKFESLHPVDYLYEEFKKLK